MNRINIKVMIEEGADNELYLYLSNVPARRRATLLRSVATKGLKNEKAGFAVGAEPQKLDIELASAGKKTNTNESTKSLAGKEDSLRRALGDSPFLD